MKKYLGLVLVLIASTSVFAADGKISGTKFKQQCLICHVSGNINEEGVAFPVSPNSSNAITNAEFGKLRAFLKSINKNPVTSNPPGKPTSFQVLADNLMDQSHFTGDGAELKAFFNGVAAGSITNAK